MAFGLIGLFFVSLVVGGIAVALMRGARSSRDGGADDSGGGGIGMGMAVVLIGFIVLVAAGIGALLFGVSSSLSMITTPPSRPGPGELTVHVNGTSLAVENLDLAIEPALLLSLAEGYTYSGGRMGSGFHSNFGNEYTFESSSYSIVGEGADGAELDFDSLCMEYEFALLGITPEDVRPGDLEVVIGYRSIDGSVERAAQMQWSDGEARLVEVDPISVFPDQTFAVDSAGTIFVTESPLPSVPSPTPIDPTPTESPDAELAPVAPTEPDRPR